MATVTPSVSGPGPTLGHVPSTMAQALLLSRYQLRDYLRSRRFVLMMAIVGVIGAILTFILSYYNSSDTVRGLTSSSDAFYGSFWAGGVTVVIIFSGIIFGGDVDRRRVSEQDGVLPNGTADPVGRASTSASSSLPSPPRSWR